MSADPKNPKVGDRFVPASAMWPDEGPREITAIGISSVLYVLPRSADGVEFRARLAWIAENWTASEPLITEPLTIWRYRPSMSHIGWASSGPFTSGGDSAITILPDHTWIEGAP